MKLDDINTMWSDDCKIDPLDLAKASLDTPVLHAKYTRLLSQERLILRKLEVELKSLKQSKYEFYTMGHTKETKELGWELPPKGMILKSEAQVYVDTDKDVVDATLKVAYQLEKVDTLVEYIKAINNRQWIIRNAIEWNKFQAGV